MRVFVTGSQGQLARCLAENKDPGVQLIFGTRPEFDLMRPTEARKTILDARPDVIINAAAYTAVDKAESDKDVAFAVNRDGARAVAEAGAILDVPVIHISTDYVFSGNKSGSYIESDDVGPTGVYGASKLAGENAVREVAEKHLIFRTAWVYSVYGANFLKTMLRIGSERPELRVVSDQHGNPTSAHDLGQALISVCNLLQQGRTSWGTFHLAGSGETTWHGFATQIFAVAERYGKSIPKIAAISTADYPTPASRPSNSRLSCEKARTTFGLSLPHWSESTEVCVAKLIG
jgi:dTDP-4-dehydrorhamnose reductase